MFYESKDALIKSKPVLMLAYCSELFFVCAMEAAATRIESGQEDGIIVCGCGSTALASSSGHRTNLKILADNLNFEFQIARSKD